MSPPALLHPQARAFLHALLVGDREGARAVAHAALRAGLVHLYEDVIGPALEEVGALWEANQITVADEHAATALAQATVASLYPEISWPIPGPKALVACVEGERHELGARMVADLLGMNGWHTLFLGADTPTDALVRMAVRVEPVLIALSVTVPRYLEAAHDAVTTLKSRLPHLKVLAGGRAVARLPDALDLLGADAVGRNAAAAVELARSWRTGLPPPPSESIAPR